MYLVQIHGSRWGMESYLVLFLSFFLIDYSFTLFIFLIQCIINGMLIYKLKALYIMFESMLLLGSILNKISYLNAFVISIHSPTSIIANFGSIFVLVNFMMIMFFVKFVLCIKHVIFISSLQWYLLILCGIYFQDELFSFYFLILYSMTTIFILWDCHFDLRLTICFCCIRSELLTR